jgi:hypothetical protein
MEKAPKNETFVSEEDLSGLVKKVQEMYIQAAQNHLPESDPLRDYIVEYYSNNPQIHKELTKIFSGLTTDEIENRINTVGEILSDKTFFVENFQKIKERTDVFKRLKIRKIENPVATDEEYELGAYKEHLESQVADAVFMLRKKGYITFQSGFKEKNLRDQFIDMYNKNVQLPPLLVNHFKNKSFEIIVEKSNDRTTLSIKPTKKTIVSLEEWKLIWDEFAEMIPSAIQENLSNIKRPSLYVDFINEQDNIRF